MKENKTISFTIRIEPSVFKKLVSATESGNTSVNQKIRDYINVGLKKESIPTEKKKIIITKKQ